MIRRDYIMRLIQQLMDSLFLLLNKKGLDDTLREAELGKLYKSYLGGERTFYLNNSEQDILEYIESKYGSQELLDRIEMLTEIMYQDGMLSGNEEEKKVTLSKALWFLNHLDTYSPTYSLVREGKMEEIRKVLNISLDTSE